MIPELLALFGKSNLAMAGAVLAVLAIRAPIRKLFGARCAYGLWALAPLAALFPLLPRRIVEVPMMAPPALDAVTFPAPSPDALVNAITIPAAASHMPDLWVIAAWLWFAGAALTAVFLGFRQAYFLEDMKAGLAGPAVVGFLRPRIVTPSDFAERFSPREQAVVLAHEKVHLARRDAQVNALAALARCLCWFNPLVHIGAHTMRIDQELACDAAVLERHPKSRKPYAQALFKTQLAARPLPLGCYWPAGTEHPLTERIAMLNKHSPGRARRVAGTVAIGVLTAAGGYLAWEANPVLAQTVISTQDAVTSALAAPSQATVAKTAAAPTVKPGAGGGSADFSRSDPIAAAAAAARAAAAAARPEDYVTQGGAYMLDRQERNWPKGPLSQISSGVNRVTGTLTTADGQTFALGSSLPGPTLMTGVGGYRIMMNGAGQQVLTMATKLFVEDGKIQVYSAYKPEGGPDIAAPMLIFPLDGGTAEADIPGGGHLSLTISGAHTLNEADRRVEARIAADTLQRRVLETQRQFNLGGATVAEQTRAAKAPLALGPSPQAPAAPVQTMLTAEITGPDGTIISRPRVIERNGAVGRLCTPRAGGTPLCLTLSADSDATTSRIGVGLAPADQQPVIRQSTLRYGQTFAATFDGGYRVSVTLVSQVQDQPAGLISQTVKSSSAQGTVSSALGVAPQPKVTAPPAAATVTPGRGGGPNDSASAPEQPGPAITRIQGTPDGYQPGADHACFQCNFDGGSPVLINGKVTGVDYTDGMYSYTLIRDSAGKLFRVQGARIEFALVPEQRAQLDAAVGKDVIVRGYNALDTACVGGCLVNSRDMNYPDGSHVIQAVPQVTPPPCVVRGPGYAATCG